jgi:hypothetical protein
VAQQHSLTITAANIPGPSPTVILLPLPPAVADREHAAAVIRGWPKIMWYVLESRQTPRPDDCAADDGGASVWRVLAKLLASADSLAGDDDATLGQRGSTFRKLRLNT